MNEWMSETKGYKNTLKIITMVILFNKILMLCKNIKKSIQEYLKLNKVMLPLFTTHFKLDPN